MLLLVSALGNLSSTDNLFILLRESQVSVVNVDGPSGRTTHGWIHVGSGDTFCDGRDGATGRHDFVTSDRQDAYVLKAVATFMLLDSLAHHCGRTSHLCGPTL